ncbi:MAG: hypothetical protein RDV48_30230 [Candidatus Eremiobacteraeota bacterium]|nr:hypothetical protein [Candidatus Eremiobacteraeota bacterium]
MKKLEETKADTFKARIARLEAAGNFHGLSLAWYEKAIQENERKRPFIESLKLSKKWELAHWRKTSLSRVQILASKGCPSCKKLHGKILTVDDAEKTMPLPHGECSGNPSELLAKGFCRCKYVGYAGSE